MNNFFIDLSDKVSVALCSDRCLINFEDFDYSECLLDELYARINGIDIDELIVILHGEPNVQKDSIKVDGVPYGESKNDFEAIKHLCKAAGIPNCVFIEYSGIFANKNPAIIVEKVDGAFRVTTKTAKVNDVQVCSSDFLISTLKGLKNRYAIDDIKEADTFIDMNLLAYYKNLDILDSKDTVLFAELTIFAYAMTKIANDLYKVPENTFLDVSNEMCSTPETTNSPNMMHAATKVLDKPNNSLDNNFDVDSKIQKSPPKLKKVRSSKKTVRKENLQSDTKTDVDSNTGITKKKKHKKIGLPFGLAIFLFLVLLLILDLSMIIQNIITLF